MPKAVGTGTGVPLPNRLRGLGRVVSSVNAEPPAPWNHQLTALTSIPAGHTRSSNNSDVIRTFWNSYLGCGRPDPRHERLRFDPWTPSVLIIFIVIFGGTAIYQQMWLARWSRWPSVLNYLEWCKTPISPSTSTFSLHQRPKPPTLHPSGVAKLSTSLNLLE